MSKKTRFYPGLFENRFNREQINHALAVAIPFRSLRSLTVARPVFCFRTVITRERND